MKTKPALRRYIRREKEKYTEEELKTRSQAVWTQVEALAEFQRAHTVAAYWSLPDEVYSHAFVEKWSATKRMLLPVTRPGGELALREYRSGCTMTEAAYHIHEPNGQPVAIEEVDLILVPGMAFDRKNHRLGRGKGYYDRLLKGMSARKIGVCFDFQRVDEVPVEEHDAAVDLMING